MHVSVVNGDAEQKTPAGIDQNEPGEKSEHAHETGVSALREKSMPPQLGRPYRAKQPSIRAAHHNDRAEGERPPSNNENKA